MKVEKLNITRHNYEEFFLLYVDNELTGSQRNEVHDFLQQNPDLAEELTILQQSVLQDDVDVTFCSKAVLYRTENGITLSNYEEYFLLYVDDELNSSERQDVEKFVLQHPHLQNEFTLLRATKLPAEAIPFKNKETLYRKDKNVRAVTFQWFRVAAAAAVIAWVTMLWFKDDFKTGLNISEILSREKEDVKPRSIAFDKKLNGEQKKAIPADSLLKASQKQGVNQNVQIALLPNRGGKTNKAENKPAIRKPAAEKQYVPLVKTPDIAVNTLPENHKKDVSEIGPQQQTISNPNQTIVVVAKPPENTEVHQAIYQEVDNEDNDRSIYIGGAEINKNKLRGLFKKATGIFEKKLKKAAGPENTIQVASFEIKTK